ncbi:LOW QUALITY PROTEIN: galectin-3-binding protein A-like [Neolamprologus brichardi]|uniref:LOW QUALITY PROTEIN: galectin-3-binding protein A-like n=1 Tax=Neolamprologus brichardi TaxID=32507 RepID=UPI001643F881|nr:LOW QUALITY PROTEIN: galectin-3-binding protein A-like [Neolamprologus brichardi]
MLPPRNSLCLLLLLYVSGRAYKFDILNRNHEPREGDVRLFLFGSKNVSEGRVEIYHDGKWGTVCDDNWDMADARVLCRQLNFPGAKSIVTGKDYGQAPGPIWLDDVNCKGTETHLFTCEFKGWGETDCTHKEDVGAICETGSINVDINDSTQSLDHSIILSDFLGQIFDDGNGCDFLIVVQSPTGNKQEDGTPEISVKTICAHKMILSQIPFFNASVGITNITVNLSLTCQPHFTSFIRYIYTRKIDVTLSSALCLHQMASNFGLKQLMEDIGRLFSKILPEDSTFHNQVSFYKYAVETKDLVLEENCVQYMAWNYQNLTRSPAWSGLSVGLLRALLTRSDLVAPDEYFVLQSVERWISEKGDSVDLETQADLLGRIRFPLIPAEKLYVIESSSLLYSTHKTVYRDNMLKAFQFNVLLFSNLTKQKFGKENKDYQPRIYTAEPWSIVLDLSIRTSSSQTHSRPIDKRQRYNNRYIHGYGYETSSYSQTRSKSFSTPVHNSLIFKDTVKRWQANILINRDECSNHRVRCESFPVAKLTSQSYISQSEILFRNRVLLVCQGQYVCQIKDFKGNMASISANATQVLPYPCPDDQFIYQIVVTPEYV